MPNTIALSRIIIKPNRQRQEFDPEAINELAESIRLRGLLHPPVLRFEGADLVLVAGERRLKAIEQLFFLGQSFHHDGVEYTEARGQVPFSNLGDLSELDAEEAELDENLKRKDLTWVEHAAALLRLQQLREKQAKAAGTTYTTADLTREVLPEHKDTTDLGGVVGRVRQELIVARHLADNPDLAKAKDVGEAYKMLKKQEERKANIALAVEIGKTFSAASHTLLNVNCIKWMEETKQQFDVILTDPPYGMGADEFGDGAGKLTSQDHTYDDSEESWLELMQQWCPLSFAVAKPQAHAYVFCDFDKFHTLKQLMQKAGWYVFRTPLIAHKVNSGRVPLPDRGPRRQYELILYAIKGNKPVTNIYPDVISTQADDNLQFGAQKPVALFSNLLQRSVRPGDLVLDSFCGTGPAFAAGHQHKCIVTGLELDASRYAISAKRLEQLKAQDDGMFGGLV